MAATMTALAGALTGITPVRAQQDALAAAGRQVAQRWCVNCHVIGPEQTQGSDQVPSFRSIARKAGTTSASLHAFLAIPHGRMPDQALSNADLDAVVAYILSLKR
jgi:mono/diheme cytochrome c family protein